MIAIEVHKDPKGFNCMTCQHRHCDKSGEIPGSNGPAGYNKWSVPGVIESNTCLLPMVTDESRTYLKLNKHYKNGYLPHAGGLLDQLNPFITAMEIFPDGN